MSTSSPTSPLIELRGVSKSFGSDLILEEVDFVVSKGDFVGLIGPNGAGKTVLLKVILGLIHPDRGNVTVLGGTPESRYGDIGYVPQLSRFELAAPVSALDVVLSGRLKKAGLFRRFRPADRDKAREALERVNLGHVAANDIRSLSGGQVQRVMIARALAMEPLILLLDEPTASLDTKAGQEVYDLLDEVASRTAVVLVSHDLGVITSHAKTIACLNRRLHYHHTKELEQRVLQEVYGCPIDLIAHGHAHRVLAAHDGSKD